MPKIYASGIGEQNVVLESEYNKKDGKPARIDSRECNHHLGFGSSDRAKWAIIAGAAMVDRSCIIIISNGIGNIFAVCRLCGYKEEL